MNILRKLFAVSATVAVLLSSVSTALAFNDLSGSVFENYVNLIAERGIVNADAENFRPNDNVTRFEMAKMVKNGAQVEDDTTCSHEFADVASTNVFYSFVKALVCKGVISQNTNYRGSDNITRGEATKIVVNAFGLTTDTATGPTFSDVTASNAFYSYIETANSNGLSTGYGSTGVYGVNDLLTRGQLAKMLAVAMDMSPYGDAVGIMISASETSVPVGSSVTLTAKVVDDMGRTVRDYTGEVTFTSDAGKLSKETMTVSNGVATVTLSSNFAVKSTITAKVDGFASQKTTVAFAIDPDQKLIARATDYNLAPEQGTIIYVTSVDDDGRPVSSNLADFTVELAGSGTTGTFANLANVEGAYTLQYKAGKISGTETVTIENSQTGETTSVSFNVALPTMTIETLKPSLSVGQNTQVLVTLRDADGSPLRGKASKLSMRVMNSEHGTASAFTEITHDGNGAGAPATQGTGVYAATFTADDVVALARVEVKFDSVPVTREYIDIDVQSYNVAVNAYPTSINTINGESTLILTVTDANGLPVAGLNPATAFDIDVKTGATIQDPSGDEDYTDATDWDTTANVAGVYVTRVKAVNSTREDSSVEINVDVEAASNETISTEATLAIVDPNIQSVNYFQATEGAPAATDVLVVYVEDSVTTRGIEGLVAANFYTCTTEPTTIDGTCAAVTTAQSIGRGLYVMNPAQVGVIKQVILGNADIARYPGVAEKDNAGTAQEFVFYGDNNFEEGVSGAEIRSGLAIVALNAAGNMVAANTGVTITGQGVITAGALAATTPNAMVFKADILSTQTDKIEVNTVKVVTPTSYPSNTPNEKVFTSNPLELDLVEIDTNKSTVVKKYAVVVPVEKKGYIFNAGSATNLLSAADITIETTDSGDEGTVVVTELSAFTNPNVFLSTWTRAANADDIGTGTIAYQIKGDDDNEVVQEFELVNPTVEVMVSNDQVLATKDNYTPATNPSAATGLDANPVGLLSVSNVFALVRDDHGIPMNVTPNASGVEVTLEVADGNGVLAGQTAAAPVALTYTKGDEINLTTNINVADNGVLVDGVYGAFFIPEEEADTATIDAYTQYDDAEVTSVAIETVYPTATLVLFPTGINPQTSNDTAYAIVVVLDQYGNSVLGLTSADDWLTIQFDGDDYFKGATFNNSDFDGDGVKDGQLYLAEYSTDDEDTYPVIVKYNDDAIMAESELIVEVKD